MRLDKYLSDAGIGTRSEVKTYIKKGRISVNGSNKVKPDTKIEANDLIYFDNDQVILKLGYKYFIMNKPAGVISATEDAMHKTVLDLIDSSDRKGLSAIGRLDKDTEGLLLLTDDGAFNHSLMSPKKHVNKTYFATLSGECPKEVISIFKSGMDIGDDSLLKPAELVICENPREVYITISEGRYHQIKRMFKKVGLTVEYLQRVCIGKLELPKDLELGEYREMTAEEIKLCKG